MAVVDVTLYKNTTNLPIDAVAVAGQGGGTLDIVAKIPITNGDSATSIYRICEVPSNFIPVGGEITCSAVTGMNDNDLGLYENAENGGAVIDVDALMDGGDLSSALVPGSGLSPISAVTIANQNAALYTLASDVSSERQSYVLALTINVGASAGGTVIVRLKLVRREYAAA
ncbi:MAG: hypothetical protein KAU50_04400 [Candidatus Marinimicrobia bacterium]|nr:hypothetical protein [Candidatus Neomarinimicrobiota bacterium]